ncbi:MAG: PAS domain S-box protein, partial [Humidesulfovibrio sp.]|nr:PAS domain S-box protein [Humidesulfovibrio sp.]
AAVLLLCGLSQQAGAVQDGVQNGAGFVRPASITVVCDDNYPPYIFRNSEGQVQGIVVDQWKAWEKAMGVRVVLQAMDWGLAQRNMREGKADVIDTIFYNEARAKVYDFTKPYAQLDVPVFFHKSLGGINDVQALRGFTVGVKAGDAVIDVLESYGINSLKEFDSYEGIINAARAGDIRIFSIDAPPALYYLYKYNLESEFRQGFVLYSGAFHRAVRKGDTDLLALVEQGFATIPAGEGKAIEEKWLGAPIVSRYNLRLVFLVFCGIAAVTLVLGFLNILLRRRVRAKVAELSATLGELRTSEERFRTIFNSVSDLIFIHAWPSGRTLDVNQRACEVYGYTREEMLSLPVEITSAGYPPYDQVHAMELMRKAYEGTPQVAEWLAKRRDGSLFWVDVSIRRARVLGQERILVSCRDIDERKRAEEALQASENTLRSLFASMTDVILILDSQGRYLEIAPTNTDRLYKPPAELLGRTLSEVFPPEQADYCLGIIRRALESGTTVSTDYHMAIGDKTIWFAGNVSPLSADRVIWVARDITERKKAEEALFESRERLQLALDAANDGLWDWRVDSGEVYFSPRCYTLLGYKPGEFPADFASFSRLLHPDDLATIYTAAETFLKDTETSTFELRMRAKSGEWKWILTRSRVVDRNASGAPVRLVGTSTDITERKRSEQALGESEERY